MRDLKTVNIKGKEYVEVSTRIKYFREHFKWYALTCNIEKLEEKFVLIRAEVKDENDRLVSDWYAYEIYWSTNVNKTSYIENAETSAKGRALWNFGIWVDKSVASADEVINALDTQQQELVEKPTEEMITDKQKKCMFALAKKLERDNLAVKWMLVETYWVNSSKELTKQQASEFIEYLQWESEPIKEVKVETVKKQETTDEALERTKKKVDEIVKNDKEWLPF